jgi:hypothetical protein
MNAKVGGVPKLFTANFASVETEKNKNKLLHVLIFDVPLESLKQAYLYMHRKPPDLPAFTSHTPKARPPCHTSPHMTRYASYSGKLCPCTLYIQGFRCKVRVGVRVSTVFGIEQASVLIAPIGHRGKDFWASPYMYGQQLHGHFFYQTC